MTARYLSPRRSTTRFSLNTGKVITQVLPSRLYSGSAQWASSWSASSSRRSSSRAWSYKYGQLRIYRTALPARGRTPHCLRAEVSGLRVSHHLVIGGWRQRARADVGRICVGLARWWTWRGLYRRGPGRRTIFSLIALVFCSARVSRSRPELGTRFQYPLPLSPVHSRFNQRPRALH